MFERLRMPSLDGATEWLNSEPLGPAELRGHVVLVDFWTLTHQLAAHRTVCPRVVAGLPRRRVGRDRVHAGVLVRARDRRRAEGDEERAIDYPVAVDNDYEIWSAFDNHYWPALYFVDTDGIIRDHHFGEGRYEQSERVIQELLAVERELVSVEGLGVEADADWDQLRTPETYLGYGRGEHFASPDGAALDERRAYELPERLRLNHWALAGEWTTVEDVVLDQAGGSIAYRFHARDAHLVLSPGAREPIPFRVLLDGEAPARRTVWTSTTTETASSGTPGSTSSRASMTRSASGRWRSRSSNSAPRRTCSRSADGCHRSQGADLVDAMGRLHRHRCHILDLVSPTPGRTLFGPAATISYFELLRHARPPTTSPTCSTRRSATSRPARCSCWRPTATPTPRWAGAPS